MKLVRIFALLPAILLLASCDGKKEIDAAVDRIDDEMMAARVAPRFAISNHISTLNDRVRDLEKLNVFGSCKKVQELFLSKYRSKILTLETFAQNMKVYDDSYLDPFYKGMREKPGC